MNDRRPKPNNTEKPMSTVIVLSLNEAAAYYNATRQEMDVSRHRLRDATQKVDQLLGALRRELIGDQLILGQTPEFMGRRELMGKATTTGQQGNKVRDPSVPGLVVWDYALR